MHDTLFDKFIKALRHFHDVQQSVGYGAEKKEGKAALEEHVLETLHSDKVSKFTYWGLIDEDDDDDERGKDRAEKKLNKAFEPLGKLILEGSYANDAKIIDYLDKTDNLRYA